MLAHRKPKLPGEVSSLLARIDALRFTLGGNFDDIIDNVQLKNILARYSLDNRTHSLAGWLNVAARQDILDWLYQYACNMESEKQYIMHWAIACNQSPATIRKLHESTPLLHMIRFDNQTPLHIAARELNTDLTACVISLNKNANYRLQGTNTPLQVAMADNANCMAKFLIMSGADPNFFNLEGNTALHTAMLTNNGEMADFIIHANYGATIFACGYIAINIKNAAGDTPFSIAAKLGKLDFIASYLNPVLRERERCIIVQQNINTSFKAAIRSGQNEIAHYLLPYVDNIKNDFSSTSSAIALAARMKNLSLVKAICKRRLCTFITDTEQQSDSYIGMYIFGNYGKAQQIAAALKLIDVLLDDDDNFTDVLATYIGPLSKGELGKINKLVLHYYNECMPLVLNDRD